MLKNKIQFGLYFLLTWLLFIVSNNAVHAVTADTMLEIRDRCNEGMTCPLPQDTETLRKSAIERTFGEEFSVDIYIKNPSQQEIISAQSWIEYDSQKLKVVKIDTSNSAFDFVAPWENHFDEKKGLIKIWRSSIGTDTKITELFLGNITFKVLASWGSASLKFYDYQLGESGHTSVRVMEENFPVNVLESKPKDFLISLQKNGSSSNWNETTQTPEVVQKQEELLRPQGLKATTGNGYIFLIWDKTENPNLKGYNLYYSTTSGRYLRRRPVGNVNQYELGDLENGKIYYLAITAYDQNNRETDYSDEVRIIVGSEKSCSSPIILEDVGGDEGEVSIISRDDYLTKVPKQPENGPAVILGITLIALFSSFMFLKFRQIRL